MYGFKDTPRIISEVWIKDKGFLERTFSNGKVYHVYMEGVQTVKIEEVEHRNHSLKNQSINTPPKTYGDTGHFSTGIIKKNEQSRAELYVNDTDIINEKK